MAQENKKRSTGKVGKRYHHGDLRQALIDGALEIISESNVDALSLRALARKVGVSYAAPYHHFQDKTQLLSELAIEGFQRLGEGMERESRKGGDSPKELLLAQGRAYLEFAVQHPSHYRVMFDSCFVGRDEYSLVKSAADNCFERLIGHTHSLLGEKVPEDEVFKVARVIWSTVHGAANLWNDGPMCEYLGSGSLEDFVEVITEPLVNMVEALAEGYRREKLALP